MINDDERRFLFKDIEIAARGGTVDEERVFREIPYTYGADDALKDELTKFARREFDEQRARQATWTESTTNDAIDRAFEELNDRGIVALQDAGSTMSAGWSDVYEVAAGRDNCRGAVFYHRQDLEGALDGGGLCLAFGALGKFDNDEMHDAASVAIAQEALDTLKKHGVPVEWTGSVGSRLKVPPFEWRKRRG